MSRKTGVLSDDTRRAIIESATKEFSEHGFENASLREICKNANVTTGALYFFFKNKNDLFEKVVSPILELCKKIINKHFEKERKLFSTELTESGAAEDLDICCKILYAYYHDKILFDLILSNHDHPLIDNFFSHITELIDQETEFMVDSVRKQGHSLDFDENMIHWSSHIQIDSILQVIEHSKNYEESCKQIKIINTFLRNGFFGMLHS